MISDESVEEAAKTIYEFLEDTPWEQAANFRDDVWFKEAARRGLEAAAPYIRAEVWDECNSSDTPWINPYRSQS